MYNTEGIRLKPLAICREQGLINRTIAINAETLIPVVTERSLTLLAGSSIETSNEKEDNCSVLALICFAV